MREILAVIPARGGSKGIPGKNRALVGGRPLVAWTFDAALASRRITRAVLTTDDERIAALGREAGIEVPFLRPPELATDETPTLPVVEHAVSFLLDAAGYRPDAIVLLQPTTPLRTGHHVDEAVALLEEDHSADSVVSVAEIPGHYHPLYAFAIQGGALRHWIPEGGSVTRRQDLPPLYTRNGAIYLFRAATLLEEKSLYGDRRIPYLMDEESSVNIDSPVDMILADALLRLRAAEGEI